MHTLALIDLGDARTETRAFNFQYPNDCDFIYGYGYFNWGSGC